MALFKFKPFSIIVLGIALLAGCSNGGSTVNDEPVTLKVFTEVKPSEEDWQRMVVDQTKKRFPNVTLERTERTSGATQINDLIASGYSPDIIFSAYLLVGNLKTLGLPQELDELIKKNKMNLDVFDPSAIAAIKNYDNGKLIAFPLYLNKMGLFYNKDIFDRFGVPYPKDGMTWNDALELTRKLTRNDGGTDYAGIIPGNWESIGSQLSLTKIDLKTNKAAVNSDGYKKVLSLIKDIYSIPGMKPVNANAFFKDRTVAMLNLWLTNSIGPLQEAAKASSPLNWDVVTTPTFPEKPGVGPRADAHIFLISSQSKHKDLAFDVIRYLTSSVEAQSIISADGGLPAITDTKVQKLFGTNVEALRGKNVQAILKTKMAPLPPFNILENTAVNAPMLKAMNQVSANQTDINTALRSAEEQINKNIEEDSAK